MEKPTDYEKCLSILVLRFLGCSQDETRSILSCRNQAVADAEQWFGTCPLDQAVGFCDEQAIKRLVGREFPTLGEISPELLVKAGQVTADDILRQYRQDYLYERPKHEKREQFLALLQQWREQVQFLSIDQLLRQSYLDNWCTDLEYELTEPEEVRRAYFQAWGRHWATIPKPYKAMLPVESEYPFKQLKELYPDAQVWKAQASWGEAYGIYWDAFSLWIVEVEYASELAMGFAMLEEGTNGDFDDKMRDARELIKKAKRAKSDIWLFLRLLALAVACDLLRLGVGQEEPDASWALEVVAQIRELRHTVVDTSMKELPKDFWLTGRNNVHAATKSLWDRYEPAKEKTIALLQALKRLQITQNNVHGELKALEHTLAS